MKTFLDTYGIKSKTFVLYGNVNDEFWCSDLSIRNLEQYLVRFLKSKGYEHIIFYGAAGTKGAYCLDAESARFFFSENRGIVLPSPILDIMESKDISDNNAKEADQSSPAINVGSESSKKNDKKIGSRITNFMNRKRKRNREGYYPGNASEDENNIKQAVDSNDTKKETNENVNILQRIRYSQRGRALSEFITEIHPLMLNKSSKMAVIFYNIFTSNLSGVSAFKDDVLNIWENSFTNNLCLMIAPETGLDDSALADILQGWGNKFWYQMTNCSGTQINPVTCFKLGMPGKDEVRNMLRRYAIVGTQSGKKITFHYKDLEKIVERIFYVSGEAASKSGLPIELSRESMREISHRMAMYIDNHSALTKKLHVTEEVINDIWNVKTEAVPALERLRKPGWEAAYGKVAGEVNRIQKEFQRLSQNTKPADRVKNGWNLSRFYLGTETEAGDRPKIPNFVLLGNPGVGKTTIARLIGDILHEAGILKIGQCIEVKREELTSSYIAGVPKATMAQVNRAEESVLFIDEAHALGRKDGGENHAGTGVEVVQTLNAVMTNPNHHLSVILAGYEKEMEDVWKLDPGFKRRFGENFIKIEDYSPELLKDILVNSIKERHCSISEELIRETEREGTVYVPIQCMVNRIYSERERENFGNAGDMETIAEAAVGRSSDGVVDEQCFYNGNIDHHWFEPAEIGDSLERIMNEFDSQFVGMENVKEIFSDIALTMEENKTIGIPEDQIPLKPIIIVGNPGTGKTSVAHMLPRLYFHYHLLGTPTPIKLNAAQLTSSFRGGIQEKILEKIQEAQNRKAFLFVDEAHALCGDDYEGAFQAFMAPLTDCQHPFMACFAVYPHKLDDFLALDPGGKSRFDIIRIEDYTPEQLFEILSRIMKAAPRYPTKETWGLLGQLCKQRYLTRTIDRGNARDIKAIYAEMDKLRKRRCQKNGIMFGTQESFMFLPEDIPERFLKTLIRDEDQGIERLKRLKKEIADSRVGNYELKEILRKKVNALIAQKKKSTRQRTIEPGHYFFKGNPGTGKTTGAKFFAKYLYELGLVQSPELIKKSVTDLIGEYQGHTGGKTQRLLQNSVGKVLLIDEAYALADRDVGTGNSYKQDAVTEIVNFLDDETYRKVSCVIFAGYERDMNALYKANDGIKSRVTEINFPDFTVEESLEILLSMIDKDNMKIEAAAIDACRNRIGSLSMSKYFSNGRTIRRFYDFLVEQVEERVSECEINNKQINTILVSDIPSLDKAMRVLNL